jgi:hypothetical protein
MRIPKYLSPTSINLWSRSVEDFYTRYLADTRTPRDSQTQPMAIGASFDAYIKSHLYELLIGKNLKYELRTLFENQVEKHNWDWAWENGKKVFDDYKEAGQIDRLLKEIDGHIGEVRFEFDLQDNIQGVPLLGKPDLFFIHRSSTRVILDWKINGFCASRTTSPAKGYTLLQPGNKIHKKCVLETVNGIEINTFFKLEDVNSQWADQLSIYAFLLGEEIGSEGFIVGLDQIVGPKDKLRFATHRLQISPEYQYNLMELIEQIWQTIQSEYIFQDVSEEESKLKCELLDRIAACPENLEFEACVGL